MTLNDAYKMATFGDRKLKIYSDYENRILAAQGDWDLDRMMEFREKHETEPVELIRESGREICVALKGSV